VATTAAISVVAVVVVVVIGASDGRLSWPIVGAMLLVAAAGAVAVAITVRRWRRAQLAELQRGYTTTTFELGRFWFAASPDGPLTLGLIQWDWRGTWVLRPDGEVVSTPSDAFDPPGLYPSPNRKDSLELWTGHQWSGYFPSSAPHP
jgi:anti-sigma-K factor RskA